MAQHAQLRIDPGSLCFCALHSLRQRGTNENTNRLLRQYCPKGTDLHRYDRDDLAAVALASNTRRRNTVGWGRPPKPFGRGWLSWTSAYPSEK